MENNTSTTTSTTDVKLTEAVKEYERCVDDPVYFINKYIRKAFTQEITLEQFNDAANKIMTNRLVVKTGFQFTESDLH